MPDNNNREAAVIKPGDIEITNVHIDPAKHKAEFGIHIKGLDEKNPRFGENYVQGYVKDGQTRLVVPEGDGHSAGRYDLKSGYTGAFTELSDLDRDAIRAAAKGMERSVEKSFDEVDKAGAPTAVGGGRGSVHGTERGK